MLHSFGCCVIAESGVCSCRVRMAKICSWNSWNLLMPARRPGWTLPFMVPASGLLLCACAGDCDAVGLLCETMRVRFGLH